MSRSWRRHPKKDLEAVLGEYYAAGWTVLDGSKYYKVRCPNGCHKRSIHLSPSNPHYGQEALQWLRRYTCYTGDVR